MRAVPAVVLVALLGCGRPAPPPSKADAARPRGLGFATGPPEQILELDASVSQYRTSTLDHRISAGTRVLRIRAKCGQEPPSGRPCVRWHFFATFHFAGSERPPVSLFLVHEGDVVSERLPQDRCEEDFLPPPRRPGCTVYLPGGWVPKPGRPAMALRVLDIVTVNAGPDLVVPLALNLQDAHE